MKKRQIFLSIGILCLIIIIIIFSYQKLSLGSILGQHTPSTFIIKSNDQVPVNSPFLAEFTIDTYGQAVNAVGLYIDFNPDKLQIINLDTSQSFCQFYPENKYDNSKGVISIACGAPNPGFTGKNTIAKVTFYAKNLGKTDLNVNPKSQILLNDGKGTNIFKDALKQNILILNKI